MADSKCSLGSRIGCLMCAGSTKEMESPEGMALARGS
jgi:hypothetical protein